MVESSRRKFLGLAGAGAASAAAAVAIGTGVLGRDDGDESSGHEIDEGAPGSFVVYVTDARKGKMTVLSGAHEIAVEDRAMAANLARMRTA
jgi:hypothetical protein